jgi:hypothetical protein
MHYIEIILLLNTRRLPIITTYSKLELSLPIGGKQHG